MNDRIRISSFLIAALFYIPIYFMYLGFVNYELNYYGHLSDGAIFLYVIAPLLLLSLVWYISAKILGNTKKSDTNSDISFRRRDPFGALGVTHSAFQHVFFHTENIEKPLLSTISQKLVEIGLEPKFTSLSISDRDKNLKDHELRHFTVATFPETLRQTKTRVVLKADHTGHSGAISWWILRQGTITKNTKFLFVAFAPLTIIFWIVSWIRDPNNFFNNFYKHYDSSYNAMDMNTASRWINEAIFEALVQELDQHGIDTSTLKEQKSQVMNINVSGGKVSMGSVVQGAMNRVSGKSTGAT